MPLITKNGQVLIDGGKLAFHVKCCCGGGAPPAPCTCTAGSTITANVAATFSEGASCAGQSVQGTTVLIYGGLDFFGKPTWFSDFDVDDYGFTVSLGCYENVYVTAVNIRTPGVCVLGLGSGGYLGAGSSLEPVASVTVNGVCRLANGSWTATPQNSGWPGGPSNIDPDFGLEITWSLSFQYPS